MHQCLRADQFDSVEKVHQDSVDGTRHWTDLFQDFRLEVQLPKRSDFKTFLELQVTTGFCQMSDTDQTKSTNFENSVASVLSNEDIDTEGCNSALHLYVDPD